MCNSLAVGLTCVLGFDLFTLDFLSYCLQTNRGGTCTLGAIIKAMTHI